MTDDITLILGSARSLPLASNSVQCVVTSPPYWNLRSYAGLEPEVWDGDEEVCLTDSDGHFPHEWGVEGEKQVHGEDTTGWLAKVGGEFGKARTTRVKQGTFCLKCGAWRGCLGNEPTVDLYVQHIVSIFDEVKRVLRPDGLCFLNIGDCYDTKTKQRWLVPHRLALALQSAGWIVRSDIIWAKGISFCRSYAGSVMPESVRDRPTCGHEHVLMLAKEAKYFYDYEAVREEGRVSAGSRGAQGSGEREGNRRPPDTWIYDGKRNPRDVWAINTKPFRGAHFATFPCALVEPCVRAGSSIRSCVVCGTPWRHIVDRSPVPRGTSQALEAARTRSALVTGRTDGFTNYKPSKNYQRAILSDRYEPSCVCKQVVSDVQDITQHDSTHCLVLDPFCGSGTVGLVCQQLGRRFIGIDASASYLRMARERLGLPDAEGSSSSNGSLHEVEETAQ
jgi:DNA modification methylase